MQKTLLSICMCFSLLTSHAQKASIKIVKGQSDIKAPLLPPGRDSIESFSISFELKGKLAAGRKDTIVLLEIDDRTKNNAIRLLDPGINISAADWDAAATAAKNYTLTIYVRTAAVDKQKYDENAYLAIKSQPDEYHTIRVLSDNNVKQTTPAAPNNNSNVSAKPDTIKYNKTFGYNNNSRFFDLKINKTSSQTEMQICSNEIDPTTNKCFKRSVTGDMSREMFSGILKDLTGKILTAPETYEESKMSVKPDDLFAEYTSGVIKASPKEKTETEKSIDSLKSLLKSLLTSGPKFKPVGELILKDTAIRVYHEEMADDHNPGPHKKRLKQKTRKRGSEKQDALLNIKDVQVTIENGSIARRSLVVSVVNDSNIFMNKRAPINFPKFDRRKKDRLYINNREENAPYIKINDLLEYKHFGKLTYPGDKYLTLHSKHLRDTLYIGTSLNQLLNMGVFTDLLGLVGRKPNGLIQTEVFSHIITNTANRPNADIVWNNYVEPYIRLSKFDSKIAALDSTAYGKNIDGKDSVNRTYLNQIAYFTGGIKANVIRFGIGINQEAYFNLGAEINLVNGDSIKLDGGKRFKNDVVFFNYYPEAIYKIRVGENFGMTTSFKFLFQRLAESAPFVNNSTQTIFNPSITFQYFPDKDEAKKVFLRFAYFDNMGYSKYNFTQLQIGYKTSLNVK